MYWGTMDRRTFMNSAASLAALGLPITPALAGLPTSGKLVVVFVQGGWDITRVFADGSTTAGWIWSPMPSVTQRAASTSSRWPAPVSSFMAANHARALVLNGVMVRSMPLYDHRLTGDTSGLMPDWPAIAGSSMADTLSHLVLGAPTSRETWALRSRGPALRDNSRTPQR